jgi:hypothetical protein
MAHRYRCELHKSSKSAGSAGVVDKMERWVELLPNRHGRSSSGGGGLSDKANFCTLPWQASSDVASESLRVLLADWVSRSRDVLPLPCNVDIVCGGPPCQGCSGHNRFRHENPMDDPKNKQQVRDHCEQRQLGSSAERCPHMDSYTSVY